MKYLFIFLILLPFESLCQGQGQGKGQGQVSLPSELKKIFFETSKFSSPVWLEVPAESSVDAFQRISENPVIHESGIPSATLYVGKGLDDHNKFLLNFLVKNNYARIESRIQTKQSAYGSNSHTFHFIFYSDVAKKSITELKTGDPWNREPKSFIRLAHRKLISIDYKNQYEDSPMGMKRAFFSIVFTYILTSDLPGLPTISKSFKGKGKVFKDPDDGEWKLEGDFDDLGISLSDRGEYEFLNSIEQQYQAYVFEPKQNPVPIIVKDEEIKIAEVNMISDNKNDLATDDTILISDINNNIAKQFIAGAAELYTSKKTGEKKVSNVIFLFSTKEGANEYTNVVSTHFQGWVNKLINISSLNLGELKRDSLFKIELYFGVKFIKLKYLNAEISIRVHITLNGKLITDELFTRSASFTMTSVEPTPVLESAIRNCEKKLAKTLGEYFAIN